MTSAEPPSSTPSLVAQLLSQGYPWLRFPAPLEAEFRDDHAQTARRWIRLGLIVALVTSSSFAVIDHLVIQVQSAIPDLVRFGLQLPVLLVILLATNERFFRLFYSRAVQICAPLFGIGTVIMSSYALPEHVALVGSRMLLVTFFLYFMLGMLTYQALRGNALILLSLIVAGIYGPMASDTATYLSFSLLCANLIGVAGAYALEHANRTAFLERKLLAEIAAMDGVTRLLNRQTFESRVRDAWAQARAESLDVSVVMVDVDHFKQFNDRYGHQAGDVCLRGVADAVQSVVSATQRGFVARYGGEEIIAVLIDCPATAAEAVAQQIVASVQALNIEHASAPAALVTVSVGATTQRPQNNDHYDAVVRRADDALYAAKRQGRNCSVFIDTHVNPTASTGDDTRASDPAATAEIAQAARAQ